MIETENILWFVCVWGGGVQKLINIALNAYYVL